MELIYVIAAVATIISTVVGIIIHFRKKSSQQTATTTQEVQTVGDTFGDVKSTTEKGASSLGSGKAISDHGQDSSQHTTINVTHMNNYINILGNDIDLKDAKKIMAESVKKVFGGIPQAQSLVPQFTQQILSSSSPSALSQTITTISGLTATAAGYNDADEVETKIWDTASALTEVKCPNCGHANRANMSECSNCGQMLK
ncbi:MAG: zinc ribbon domain-containing protein [Candidatus Zixiibacteriota bacterium]